MNLLDKNELPFDFPHELKKEIVQSLVKEQWNRYPSMYNKNLKKSIANHSNISQENIFIGTGASGLLQHLISIYKNKYDRILFPSPCFVLYDFYTKIYDLKQVHWRLTEHMQYDYINYPGRDGTLNIFCHPNNPSGELIDPEFLEVQIQNEPNSTFIIDEAYVDFSGKSFIHLVNKYENVVVIRTLSKAFGLAGIRLGWCTCHDKMASFLKGNEVPFQLNHFSVILGQYIFDNYDKIVVPIIEKIVNERERLFEKLSGLFKGTPNKVYPSAGNFILIETELDNFIEHMQDCSFRLGRVKEFPKCIRITIGTREQNDKCVTAIEKLMSLASI